MYTNFKISAEELLTGTIQKTKIPFYHAKNMTIVTDPAPAKAKILKGDYFIVEPENVPFFHVLNDIFGQYEILKNQIPELKILYISKATDYENLCSMHKFPFLKELFITYDIDYDTIVYAGKQISLKLENVYFINTDYKCLESYMSIKTPNPESIFFKDYLEGSIKGIQKRFFKESSTLETPKKIFISRGTSSLRVQKMKQILDDKIFNNIDNEYNLFTDLSLRQKDSTIYEIMRRFISKEDEDLVEKYFDDLGYTVVDPSTMSYLEQVDLYRNATHVAALSGSGIYNTIHCNKEAKVFIININCSYDFWHHLYALSATKNVYQINEFDSKKIRSLDGRQIIEEIEKANWPL